MYIILIKCNKSRKAIALTFIARRPSFKNVLSVWIGQLIKTFVMKTSY